MFRNFVQRTKEVAGQSAHQLNIHVSRLMLNTDTIRCDRNLNDAYRSLKCTRPLTLIIGNRSGLLVKLSDKERKAPDILPDQRKLRITVCPDIRQNSRFGLFRKCKTQN